MYMAFKKNSTKLQQDNANMVFRWKVFFHMFKIPKILKFVDYCVEEFSKTYCGIMSYKVILYCHLQTRT